MRRRLPRAAVARALPIDPPSGCAHRPSEDPQWAQADGAPSTRQPRPHVLEDLIE